MNVIRAALIGILAFLSALGGIVLACIYLGFAPMAADSVPSAFEAALAMKAVHAVSEREMGKRRNPLSFSPENVAAGMHVYERNCLMCHGAADGKPSIIAQGFYVPSPQFASDGAEDDPEGATYWKVHHGIRFTAMPAFRNRLSEAQIWQVAMFLKHMDQLPKGVKVAWKSTKSVGFASTALEKPRDMKM